MRRIWRQALEAVTPYEAGKSLEALSQELRLPAIVRLSSNENPLGPSPLVIEALRQEAARAHLYPDGGSTRLREALGSWLGVPPDWLMAGNGGDELLGLIARAAFEPGDEILMSKPAFEPYGIEARLSAATAHRAPYVLQDRRARRPARGLSRGVAREHGLAQPRARALQRQPIRPGRGGGRPRGPRPSRAHARARPGRAAAPPGRIRPARLSRAALAGELSPTEGRCAVARARRRLAQGGHPGARRGSGGLPGASPDHHRATRRQCSPPGDPGSNSGSPLSGIARGSGLLGLLQHPDALREGDEQLVGQVGHVSQQGLEVL